MDISVKTSRLMKHHAGGTGGPCAGVVPVRNRDCAGIDTGFTETRWCGGTFLNSRSAAYAEREMFVKLYAQRTHHVHKRTGNGPCMITGRDY